MSAALRPVLPRLAGDVLAAAGAAVAWWTGELAGFMPARLRRSSGVGLVVEPTPAGLTVGRDTPGSWEVLATFEDGMAGRWPGRQGAPEPAGSTLRLPPDMALQRTITLAAAAAENLHEVVGFQLDRYAPFEPEEVYLGCRVVGRDVDSETTHVAIAVALRADVDALLGAAAGRGLACTRVVVPGDRSAAELALDLGVSDAAPSSTRWRLLWAAAAVLLVLDVAVPLVHGHMRLTALRGELATVRREAAAVATLRGDVDQMAEQAAMPVQRWLHSPPLSALLTEVTRLVPDTGWVTQMQIDAGAVQLTGYAASANALIPVLEQSQLLTNASFRSPVTQDPVHGVEQFHLSVDLRKMAE